MSKNAITRGLLDYGSIAVAFLIFMLAWFNGNLTDMPWYELAAVILLAALSALAVFAMLEVRGHRRAAIAFAGLLLLMSVPSMMHRSFGPLSTIEMMLFYLKQIYLPLLAGFSLVVLLKRKRQVWRALLRWGTRLYTGLGVMLGTIILHNELTREAPVEINQLAEMHGDITTFFAVITIIGTILTVIGLIVNPLYIAWRNGTHSTTT